MIRDMQHETMPREALEALQLKRLQALVERVYHLVDSIAGAWTRWE